MGKLDQLFERKALYTVLTRYMLSHSHFLPDLILGSMKDGDCMAMNARYQQMLLGIGPVAGVSNCPP